MLPEFAVSKSPVFPSGVGSKNSPSLEVAHLLSVSVIDYDHSATKEAVVQMIQALRSVAYSTPEFARSSASQSILCQPTEKGLLLIFFREILCPIRCASEIAFVLKNQSHIPVTMGIHSGTVSVVRENEGKTHVSGEGVATAEKVMNLGDADHILISESYVEMISRSSPWFSCLIPLGVAPFKSAKSCYVYNFCTRDYGNPNTPLKFVWEVELASQKVRNLEWWKTVGRGFLQGGKVFGTVMLIAGIGWAAYPYAIQFYSANPLAVGSSSTMKQESPANHRASKKSGSQTESNHRPRYIDSDNSVREKTRRPDRLIEDTSDANAPPPPMLETEAPRAENSNEEGANEKNHQYNLVLTIPEDQAGSRLVKVTCLDAHGLQPTMLESNFSEGDRIPMQFEGIGKEVTVRVYFNDKLSKEWRITPPASSSSSPQEIY